MLYRQRAILALIEEAGGEASRLDVTKWAFLLRQESATAGGSAFYQFLPYKYGPFSFCLFQEAGALVRNGLLHEEGQAWRLTPKGASKSRSADRRVRDDAKQLLGTHPVGSSSALIDYVYEKYPWFTVNSEIRQLERRPYAECAVYTVGYEGLLVDGFLNGLMKHGIRRLIDVRNNPVSRRYGFHKTTLGRLCGRIGVEYVHVPELGIDSRERQDLDQPGAREALFDHYARTTLRRESDAIDEVTRLVQEMPSAFMCMEASHHDCHRSRLAKRVAERSGLPERHVRFQV